MTIISILEPLPTHIVTSPSTSFCLFCNRRFELLIFSNRTSIKYSGATINTSKVHINNLYIKYTLVHFAILLIHQIFKAFPLLVTIPLQYNHSVSGFGPALGFFGGVTTCLPFYLKFPLFSFAIFLKLVI